MRSPKSCCRRAIAAHGVRHTHTHDHSTRVRRRTIVAHASVRVSFLGDSGNFVRKKTTEPQRQTRKILTIRNSRDHTVHEERASSNKSKPSGCGVASMIAALSTLLLYTRQPHFQASRCERCFVIDGFVSLATPHPVMGVAQHTGGMHDMTGWLVRMLGWLSARKSENT